MARWTPGIHFCILLLLLLLLLLFGQPPCYLKNRCSHEREIL